MLEAVFVYEMIDPLSIHVSFSEIITFLSPDTHTYAFQVTKNVSITENFAYVLNE